MNPPPPLSSSSRPPSPSQQYHIGGRKSAALAAVEQVARYLRVPRLESIRSRILALAVLGTLLPTGIALGVAYTQNRRAREAQVTQELVSQSTQGARAMSAWLLERLYDLRVFANSDEVSTNLNRFVTAGLPSSRLREYLRSLHERFSDFDQLIVLDPNGRVVATSAQQAAPVVLPAGWQQTMRREGAVVGRAYWDEKTKKGKVIVAVPVQRMDAGDRMLGAFAAEVNLAPMRTLLREFARDSVGTLYLATSEGAVLASSRDVSAQLLQTMLPLERLLRRKNVATSYASATNSDVVGTAEQLPQLRWGWAVIAEAPANEAFQEVRRFRNAALLVIVLLLVVVSATAYRLGLIIVRPLERLAEGAAEVSTGDLGVDLPATGGGEVGALTTVFNHMVSRLREHRDELERLSVTDGLTGVANHRSLMQRLNEEGLRSARNKHAFSVIMADVDHFKSYNDEFGHPAGDEVLKRVAALLRESTRTVDCVARYGGEEFAILLPETEAKGALELAERIRTRVESTTFPRRQITLSLGVAEFPKDAELAQGVVAAADRALYAAKREGRNRVAQVARVARKSEKAERTEKVLPTAKRPSKTTRKKG